MPKAEGRVVIDGGATNLKTHNVVNARDASVFYGSSDGAQSLLITSSSNQLTGVIPGVTVQLQGTGAVTLNVVTPTMAGLAGGTAKVEAEPNSL